ncbi:MAG: hypothetical protein ACXWEX_06850 [Thermoanaerobaculia bacterium]
MSTPQDHEDRRLRRKTAAFRLKHDVGKALRWSAPEERETNPDELRARLVADLLPRTRGGGAGRDVLQSFFEWKREEGPLFASGDPDLEAVERAMTVVGRLAPRLSSLEESLSFSESLSVPQSSPLSESSLLSLDEACLEASRACTAFYRRVALDDGPEIAQPLGARR